MTCTVVPESSYVEGCLLRTVSCPVLIVLTIFLMVNVRYSTFFVIVSTELKVDDKQQASQMSS